MVKGVYTMFHSSKAEELWTFIHDKLGFNHSDGEDGRLIFGLPEADMGCHPSDKVVHDVSFYCDDIQATVAQLTARGIEFTSGITDKGFGLVTTFRMPGGVAVQLYEPN
jgi:predicted enzyme related to lactoylglutathione lyase